MNAVDRYSEKVVSYAQYRWDYAAEATQALVTECGLSEDWVIADVGSGTGMVSRQFVDRVRTVFAVEPNSDMRRIAIEALGGFKSYHSVNGFSDATTLPDNSVRMITVGRALHWFPAESTRAEFCRILERDVREVFEQHAANGVLTVSNATKIAFGQVYKKHLL